MGKRVAVITYHRSDNFGSVLQCYALLKKLQQMGYDAKVIDYRKAEVEEMYQVMHKPTSRYLLLTDIYHLLHYRKLKKRHQRFENFRNKYFDLTEIYSSKEILTLYPPEAEVFITGSDQVWNTKISDFDESYLLSFVKNGRKVAYAASGVASLNEIDIASLKTAIANFDAVSLRENKAVQLLGEYEVVIDPVLLLKKEDWEDLCIPQYRKKPYMLCYFSGGVSSEFENYTKTKAKEMGLERIVLMPEWRNLFRSGNYIYDSGPVEFISLIREAELICTNSFHGTAFSVILNKPFIVGQHIPFSDDRIASLLGWLGLSEREIDPTSPKFLSELDYKPVNEKMAIRRREDIQWLKNAIEGD